MSGGVGAAERVRPRRRSIRCHRLVAAASSVAAGACLAAVVVGGAGLDRRRRRRPCSPTFTLTWSTGAARRPGGSDRRVVARRGHARRRRPGRRGRGPERVRLRLPPRRRLARAGVAGQRRRRAHRLVALGVRPQPAGSTRCSSAPAMPPTRARAATRPIAASGAAAVVHAGHRPAERRPARRRCPGVADRRRPPGHAPASWPARSTRSSTPSTPRRGDARGLAAVHRPTACSPPRRWATSTATGPTRSSRGATRPPGSPSAAHYLQGGHLRILNQNGGSHLRLTRPPRPSTPRLRSGPSWPAGPRASRWAPGRSFPARPTPTR